MTRCHRSAAVRSKGPLTAMPAFATTTDAGPRPAATPRAASASAARSVTSHSMQRLLREEPRGLPQGRPLAPQQGDPHPGLGEAPGERLADAASGAGNDRDPVLQGTGCWWFPRIVSPRSRTGRSAVVLSGRRSPAPPSGRTRTAATGDTALRPGGPTARFDPPRTVRRGVTTMSNTARGVSVMGADRKAQAKTDQAKGKVKETAGRAVGNERLVAEGRADQTKGDAREAKEKTKDAFKN
ncbi:hypothetical protein SCALM49S_08426 [Streptomyces californicus]